jgi:hypothetical protein
MFNYYQNGKGAQIIIFQKIQKARKGLILTKFDLPTIDPRFNIFYSQSGNPFRNITT